jgi:hypothetical protein
LYLYFYQVQSLHIIPLRAGLSRGAGRYAGEHGNARNRDVYGKNLLRANGQNAGQLPKINKRL